MFGFIREADKVFDHVQQAHRVKQPLNHRVQGGNAVLLAIFIASDFAPGVEIFVRRKQVAHAVINAVADNAQRVIDKQLRNIAAVASAELFIRIANTGFLLAHRAFKFKYHQWQAIDIQNGIRDTRLVFFTGNGQLIDNFNPVQRRDKIACWRFSGLLQWHLFAIEQFTQRGGQVPGIEQFDIEIFLLAIVAFKQETVGQPGAEGFIAFVKIGGRQGGELFY